MTIQRMLYNIAIVLYGLSIRIASLFSDKARQWVRGRENWAERLAADRAGLGEGPLVWIHCASLGEFEQGRPLIEWLKEQRPDVLILLTFFSPSGYEIRKNYERADLVAYLPLDTSAHARQFLDIARPRLAIFVKYEFWYHYLHTLEQRQVPHVLISAIFREEQVFFKSHGAFFRRLLRGFDFLFVQDKASSGRLKTIGVDENVAVAGDTRIDRVLAIADRAQAFPLVAEFADGAPVFVIGSSWPRDEARFVPFLNQQLPADWKVIIAPHQIREKDIRRLEAALELPAIRYSQRKAGKLKNARVLIIDNIGMLSGLYRYGRLAYIGGGFGVGIHNTLEPIAFGLPVIFGPKYRKFAEAVALVQSGAAYYIQNTGDLARIFDHLLDEAPYADARKAARAYVERNRGATGQIGAYLLRHFLQ